MVAAARASLRVAKAPVAKKPLAVSTLNDKDDAMSVMSELTDLPSERGASSDDEQLSDEFDEDAHDDSGTFKATKAKRKAGGALPRANTKKPKQKSTTKKTQTSKSSAASKRKENAKDAFNIQEDNRLFNAVLEGPSASVKAAEDWLVEYQNEAGPALAQLVNFFLRACACNESVDEDQAQDLDGVPDTLDDIQELFKRENLNGYPLISKGPAFRKFRSMFSETFGRVLACAADAEALSDDVLLPSLAAWLSAQSSSTLRSFRHTATFAALVSITHVNKISLETRHELQLAKRSSEVEKKKARADKSRMLDLDERVQKYEELYDELEQYTEDMFNSVFVHRYRDSDPAIRADCVQSLGLWMKLYPDKYMKGQYFRYLGWLLSDQDASARLTAIKAMVNLYDESVFRASVRHFTDLFKPRLIEIAIGDVDHGVRGAVLELFKSMHEHDLFENDEIAQVTQIIFSDDSKLRDRVASFVMQSIQVELDDMDLSDESEETIKAKKFEVLLRLLTSTGGESETIFDPPQEGTPGRIALATEAFLQHDEELKDWRSALTLLLTHVEQLDSNDTGAEENLLDLPTSLSRHQESTLLEMLAVMIRFALNQADETELVDHSDLTALLDALPRLLARYRTDTPLIMRVLLIVKGIPEKFWQGFAIDDKASLTQEMHGIFERHAEEKMLVLVARCTSDLTKSTSDSGDQNNLSTLAEDVIQKLREGSENRELDTAALSESDVHQIFTNLKRLKAVLSVTPIAMLDRNVDATDAWGIVFSIATRGRLGYEEENEMVVEALTVLSEASMWIIKTLANEGQQRVPRAPDALSPFFRLLKEYTRADDDMITVEVSHCAFMYVCTIMLLHHSLKLQSSTAEAWQASALAQAIDSILSFEDISVDPMYSFEKLLAKASADKSTVSAKTKASVKGHISDDESELSEAEDQENEKDIEPREQSGQDWVHRACSSWSLVIRLTQFGVLELNRLQHGLAYFGKISPTFDALVKASVEIVKRKGSAGRTVAHTCDLIATSLKQAFDSSKEDAKHFSAAVSLAKLLSNALVVRGPHLSILSTVHGAPLVNLHVTLIHHFSTSWVDIAGKGDKRISAKVISTFKALTSLLNSAKPRDAIAIKLALDKATRDLREDEETSSKILDSLQAYEKRLLTIASKHSGLDKLETIMADKRPASQSPTPENRPRPRPVAKRTADRMSSLSDQQEDSEDEVAGEVVPSDGISEGASTQTGAGGNVEPAEQPRKRARKA